jgi:outer membrane immunogenic protein
MSARGVILALGALLGSSFSAMAADMPVKAPPAPLPGATNWTGVYVNAGYGYGIWSADTTTEFPSGSGICRLCFNQVQGGKGWLGVVGIGYDFQFTPNIVAGVFGDFNFADLKGTIQDQDPYFAGETSEKWAWAAGARVGWLFTPDILAYVNGGYTSARFSSADMVTTFDNAPTGFSTADFTAHGWFIGGGTEMAMHSILGLQLGPGWFWRNEYRYASYQNKTLPDTSPAGGLNSDINFKPSVQTVTSQLVYKFNTGGPVYPAAPLPPANWTGFYVNGGFGYGGWAADTTTVNPVVPGPCNVLNLCTVQVQGGKGWLGVAGAGFDFQVMPTVVIGVFGDYNFTNFAGTIQDQQPYFAADIKQKSAWAAGARAGWVVTPQILSYVNGGYTSARFSDSNMVTTFVGASTPFGTSAFDAHGWFLGGGVDIDIAPNLFWRNEYRLARYSEVSIPDTAPGFPAGSASDITFKPTVQTITTQLVYKFNWMH